MTGWVYCRVHGHDETTAARRRKKQLARSVPVGERGIGHDGIKGEKRGRVQAGPLTEHPASHQL